MIALYKWDNDIWGSIYVYDKLYIYVTINAFVDLCFIFIPINLGVIICVKQFITDSTDDIDNINTNNECILNNSYSYSYSL